MVTNQVQRIEPTEVGLEILVKVNGFHDARRWMHRLVGAGLIECGQCEQPATHIFFQDQAEWYFRCPDHREFGAQWTGSTRWSSPVLSMVVIAEKAKAWVAGELTEAEQRGIRLRTFDATDYWSLIDERQKEHQEYVEGSTDHGAWLITVYPLTTGNFAYTLKFERGSKYTRHSWEYDFVGQFPSVEAAVQGAKLDKRLKSWLTHTSKVQP